MNRPDITKEIILEAAKQIAERLDGDAETIASYYRYPMDGYELARELDRYASWDLTMADVEELDAMTSIVGQLHREAEKKWGEEHQMQPPFPVGAEIGEGVIAGIYEHQPAYYLVKERGCTQDGRFLLIRFEDARAA